MRKRSREINIFSMSALDLFASALGAFILITAVTIPFFPNTGDTVEGVAALKQKLEALESEIDKTKVVLGIKTQASRFVIAIDMSGSLFNKQVSGAQDYTPYVKNTMAQILESLSESSMELILIGFHSPEGSPDLHLWPDDGSYFSATSGNKNVVINKINEWMDGVVGGTPTKEALFKAMELKPEEIILLTDGQPSDVNINPWQKTVKDITAQNINKIPIHAVAVGDYVTNNDFIDFLKTLTKSNNGSLVGSTP